MANRSEVVSNNLGFPRRRRWFPTLVSLSLIFVVADATAAPKAKLWPRWTTHNPASTASIDHGPWQLFLSRYVRAFPDGINRIPYGRVTGADKKTLESYTAQLGSIPISTYNRDEQRAYWINLYNALTIKVILDHYPVKSIRQIKPSPFAIGPWREKLITVEGEKLSLDDIEHRILRPIWRDPRLHYALNCTALSCPNLQREVFTASSANALLTRAAREYINTPRAAQVKDGELIVSSVYRWYEEDFGNSDQAVIRHLLKYANPALATQLNQVSRIAGDRYDWALNDAAKAQ